MENAPYKNDGKWKKGNQKQFLLFFGWLKIGGENKLYTKSLWVLWWIFEIEKYVSLKVLGLNSQMSMIYVYDQFIDDFALTSINHRLVNGEIDPLD